MERVISSNPSFMKNKNKLADTMLDFVVNDNTSDIISNGDEHLTKEEEFQKRISQYTDRFCIQNF